MPPLLTPGNSFMDQKAFILVTFISSAGVMCGGI